MIGTVKTPCSKRRLLAALVFLLPSFCLLAQEKAKTDDEVIVLTPFDVTVKANADRYSASAATSGGRVAVNLADSIQSVAVVTRDLMNDSAAMRILDATTFAVAGVCRL